MKRYPQIYYPGADSKLNSNIIERKSYKSGATEFFFEFKLDKYFRGHVLKNSVLDDERKKPYMPDYVIQYPEHGIYIDIEIDEPYAFRSGIPIHTNDSARNDYFLNNGWSIIRFAEEQICKQPELCCKVIAEHLRNLSGEHIWIEGFHHLSRLADVESWDKQAAEKMAESRYRYSYMKLLQKVIKKRASISILIDGIFLNGRVARTYALYQEIFRDRKISNHAEVSGFLQYLQRYFYKFDAVKDKQGRIYVEAVIHISAHHSFYDFTFDTDVIFHENYVINVFYIRTRQLICFEITDYIQENNLKNVILVADDPAYPPLIETIKGLEIVYVREVHNSHMPPNYSYVDIIEPVATAIGIAIHDL